MGAERRGRAPRAAAAAALPALRRLVPAHASCPRATRATSTGIELADGGVRVTTAAGDEVQARARRARARRHAVPARAPGAGRLRRPARAHRARAQRLRRPGRQARGRDRRGQQRRRERAARAPRAGARASSCSCARACAGSPSASRTRRAAPLRQRLYRPGLSRRRLRPAADQPLRAASGCLRAPPARRCARASTRVCCDRARRPGCASTSTASSRSARASRCAGVESRPDDLRARAQRRDDARGRRLHRGLRLRVQPRRASTVLAPELRSRIAIQDGWPVLDRCVPLERAADLARRLPGRGSLRAARALRRRRRRSPPSASPRCPPRQLARGLAAPSPRQQVRGFPARRMSGAAREPRCTRMDARHHARRGCAVLGELTPEEIDGLLRSEAIGRIGCYGFGRPYVVPVTYAYDGIAVYCHSREGLKLRMMRSHPTVCFEVDRVDGVSDWQSVIATGQILRARGDGGRARDAAAADGASPRSSRAPRACRTAGSTPRVIHGRSSASCWRTNGPLRAAGLARRGEPTWR